MEFSTNTQSRNVFRLKGPAKVPGSARWDPGRDGQTLKTSGTPPGYV